MLVKVFWQKEKVFYRERLSGLFRKSPVGTILFGLIFIALHYCVAIMHFGFECVMYVINRPQYKLNMQKLAA